MNKKLIILLAPLLLSLLLVASQALALETPAASGDDMHGMMMDKMKSEMMAEKMSGESPMQHGMLADGECPLGYDDCPLGRHNGMMHREHHSPAMKHDKGVKSHGMMMPMQPGMMQHRMDHVFYLDRIDALELSTEQVSRLKAIRNECRRDNIRQAAETQITRLELMEMLDEPDWDLKRVEPLVRQAQKQEADMLVRHLKAMQDALLVLTAEQRTKVDAGGDDLEELFH